MYLAQRMQDGAEWQQAFWKTQSKQWQSMLLE